MKSFGYLMIAAMATSVAATNAWAGQSHGRGGNGQHQEQSAVAVAGASSGGNSLSDGGSDTKVDAWGLSYVDSAPQVPQAVVGDGVVVTSQNIKVLGPVFGYAWQTLAFTPAGMFSLSDLGLRATTNDGTALDQQKQFVAIAAICAHDPEYAKQLNFGCK